MNVFVALIWQLLVWSFVFWFSVLAATNGYGIEVKSWGWLIAGNVATAIGILVMKVISSTVED